jgi:hypothetical protein
LSKFAKLLENTWPCIGPPQIYGSSIEKSFVLEGWVLGVELEIVITPPLEVPVPPPSLVITLEHWPLELVDNEELELGGKSVKIWLDCDEIHVLWAVLNELELWLFRELCCDELPDEAELESDETVELSDKDELDKLVLDDEFDAEDWLEEFAAKLEIIFEVELYTNELKELGITN